MFLLHRPSAREIETFLEASRHLPLSYKPMGLARLSLPEWTVDEEEVVLGNGAAAFERAKAELATWTHFEIGWVELFPKHAPTATDTVVAVVVRHLGLWSMNGCRVVYQLDTDRGRTFGFGYGTLTNHAETGEELFKVSMNFATGDVTYSIRAVSRPRALLARIGAPVTRLLQARFRRHSAAAMVRAVSRSTGDFSAADR